ncbi:MAG: right-handed parallel beta-helix repeat-containing protein, partial [Phycisphaerales bacterium]|nr:right-handed parallel beta-helix repeat-containing protein [Phycisphaerales bacterium]
KNTQRCALTGVACCLALATFGPLAAGGPLNPPAGAVAPTAKPLAEVEPRTAIDATNTPGDTNSLFKITQPGSYYLTGNITGVVGKHGIEIAASGVTLDLNGFDLVGVAGMGAFDGVSVTLTNLSNIAVINGSVRTWGDEGVDLGTLPVSNFRVEGVLAIGNAGIGISTGNSGTVSNCSANANTGHGIVTVSGSTVTNSSANANGNHGISTGSGCSISNCSAYNNIINGFSIGNGGTAANCSAAFNDGSGFGTGSACTVVFCIARANTLDGIVSASGCLIHGNVCANSGNGGDGAGIHTTGSGNRIEGNNCSNADRGIDVDFAGNIIIRNTCSGNTVDWTIAANNVVGPILDRRAPASAAINGFSFAGSLGTTDPNANFSY